MAKTETIPSGITPIAQGGTGATEKSQALRNLGLSTGTIAGINVAGAGDYITPNAAEDIFFLFGRFGAQPLCFVFGANSGTAYITSLISNVSSSLIPTVSIENGKMKIHVPDWEQLKYFSYYDGVYFVPYSS